ncbi:MAG: hypothetical protein LBK23_06045 [Oscillospiraceae bacterium]|jgi:hypothetical protein|nr:hypothetical protein [Oscillospiraceae bacterium]
MTISEIYNFEDFCRELGTAGFSEFGGGGEVFSLIRYGWGSQPYGAPIRWHTGDPDTDPWQWRLRVLSECDDIAYAKVFFGKGGFITREWYPYFVAARRDSRTFDESYYDGLVSRPAKRVFEVLSSNAALPTREIKRLGGFGREERSAFDRALRELQNMLFITICGSGRKISGAGDEYGWDEMLYCTSEAFWGADVFAEAAELDRDDAARAIQDRVRELNPAAPAARVRRFISG